ncbi:hypothetical protein AN641_05835 [Candidatus Epulonipiscioides gigas]|nr:hypothetical protein AN641_05835 [Epulopiscium sp. SCG-C07WGA-EpuloA2]
MTISQMAKLQSSYQNQLFQTQQQNKSNTGPLKSYLGETPPAHFSREQIESFNQSKVDPWMVFDLNGPPPERRTLEVPQDIEKQVAEITKDRFLNDQGWNKAGENHIADLALEYVYSSKGLANVKPEDRISMIHSISQLANKYEEAYIDKLESENIDFKGGQSYDPSIFDGWEPNIRKSIDVKV